MEGEVGVGDVCVYLEPKETLTTRVKDRGGR